MAVRTVLAYELSSKKKTTTMQREDGLDRSRMIIMFATYGSVNCGSVMSSLYASTAHQIQRYTRPLKRCWKENWNTQESRNNSPCTTAAKTYKLTWQKKASVYIWFYNLIRSQHLQARVLWKTSASHLHLADLRNWGGVASAASDTSLTCPATSWRHQDVNVEEWKSKEWV